MSQIVNAIEAVDTGERKLFRKTLYTPLFEEVVDIKSTFKHDLSDILSVYKINVTLGNTCAINSSLSVHGDNLITEAITRTKRQVIEAIFGEFRQDFRRLEKAIYDQDYNLAGKLLYEFEDKMFSSKIKE